MYRVIVSLVAALLVVSCGNSAAPEGRNPMLDLDGSGAVSLEMLEREFEPGQQAQARLVNESAESIGYNFCLVMWETRDQGEWQRLAPLRMCEARVDTLHAGEDVVVAERVEESWEAGEYRFVLTVAPLGEAKGFEVTSDVFRIVR